MSEVWYVQGDEDVTLFKTKMDAERYARELFPDETESVRYARIFFFPVVSFEPQSK